MFYISFCDSLNCEIYFISCISFEESDVKYISCLYRCIWREVYFLFISVHLTWSIFLVYIGASDVKYISCLYRCIWREVYFLFISVHLTWSIFLVYIGASDVKYISCLYRCIWREVYFLFISVHLTWSIFLVYIGASDVKYILCFYRFRTLLTDIYNLSISNDHDIWRQKEAEELSAIVQQRLRHLQVGQWTDTLFILIMAHNKGAP